MQQRRRLIIFARNPVKGKVKSRLANTVGDDKALEVYRQLLHHTFQVSSKLAIDKVIYHSDFIPDDDTAAAPIGFEHKLQQGADLGKRMQHAFEESFRAGYNAICIIGTDCLEITEEILKTAFTRLQENDAVIGPALDGGYYLLGLKAPCEELFQNKQWSSHTVLRDTLDTLKTNHLSCFTLPELRDIDTEDDLRLSSLNPAEI